MLNATGLVIALAVFGAVTPVRADVTPAVRDNAQEQFRVGAQAFRANRFAVAVLAFEEAYLLDPRPETAFSIAQANRLQYYLDKNSWRLQRALQLYQVYLDALPSGPRAQDAINRVGELGPLVGELRRRGELTAFTPASKTQLVVGAEVDNAVVLIDERQTTLWEPMDVSPGVHQVEVRAAGFEPARRSVSVPLGQFLPVDVTLRAKPGTLALRSEPGAIVYVDGQRRGSIGSKGSLEVLLAPGAHFVSTTRRGRDSWSRSVTIERDRRQPVEAPLVPTAQRRVARWVFASAGVLGLGSLGMALWGYSAYRSARDIDDARRNLTATPEQLARYNDLVNASDSRSNVALGLGIGAAAVGVLGLGMYVFDTPSPDAGPSVSLQPAADASGLSLAVQGRF